MCSARTGLGALLFFFNSTRSTYLTRQVNVERFSLLLERLVDDRFKMSEVEAGTSGLVRITSRKSPRGS